MFSRKLISSEDEFESANRQQDEDEDDDDDYDASSDELTTPKPQPFYESVRAFAPSHMHISCHYDIPYTPHIIQPPVCGVSTFAYAREQQQPIQHLVQPMHQPSSSFFMSHQHQFQSSYGQLKPSDDLKLDRSFNFTNDTQSNIIGEIFCTVPGRTSLLSSTTKYRVTVGEIQRRISPPECLNASLLGGILRKAKSKDGGKTLRDSLKKLGLTLPAGRRKQANVTAWTALVEEEALHMAKDFATVCEKEFHARDIGIYLTKNGLSIDPDVLKRRTALEMSRKIVGELSDLLASDRTPLTPYLARNTVPLDPAIQQHLSHFTLMTHGFGNVAMCAVLESIKQLIDESLKYIDRCCSQQMWR